MSMKLRKQLKKNTPLIFVSGDVSGKDAMILSDEIRQVSEGGSNTVVIDLSATASMDSSAMGVIIYWWKNLKQENRHLLLCNPHRAVVELLETTNLNKLIPIIESIESLDSK